MKVADIRRYARPGAKFRPHWWPSMKITPKLRRHNARLLVEWGVIHHIWTRKPFNTTAHLYVLCIVRNGDKAIKIFPPRWS